jgi:serine/threonine-protein kinase GIN4
MKAIDYHPNLIGFVEFVERFNMVNYANLQGKPYLALEFVQNKTLLDYLMTKPGQVDEKWVRKWFIQILDGLKHIRDKEFAHLDLKCENILLDAKLNAKIADFGFARINTEGISEDLGSEFHRAPEICIRDFPYDGEKADVFALAIVLYAMQMKSFPTERMYNVIDTTKYKIFASGNHQAFWPASPQVSVLFKDLFQGMFKQDPSARANLDQITSHPWL